MQTDVCEYGYELGKAFFEGINAPDIQQGTLQASLTVSKKAEAFLFDFHIAGEVIVQCDRCLDDMSQSIETDETIWVKLGEEYKDDDSEMIIIPEDDGVIDVAWLMYEFILLNIPLQHVHPEGQCNQSMMKLLQEHTPHTAIQEATGDSTTHAMDSRWDELKKLINK